MDDLFNLRLINIRKVFFSKGKCIITDTVRFSVSRHFVEYLCKESLVIALCIDQVFCHWNVKLHFCVIVFKKERLERQRLFMAAVYSNVSKDMY